MMVPSEWRDADPELLRLLLEHTKYREGGSPIGTFGEITVEYFVDLNTPCHIEASRNLLARHLVAAIPTQWRPFNAVVGLQGSNILLADAVSRELDAHLLSVRSSVLFGISVHGRWPTETRAIVVDDVVTDLDGLIDACATLRHQGIEPAGVLTMIQRKESGLSDFKRRFGIPTMAVLSLSDDDIRDALAILRSREELGQHDAHRQL